MKRTYILCFFFLLFLLGGANSTFAFRCQGKVVNPGDTKFEVLSKCGEPTWVEKRTVKRIETFDDDVPGDQPFSRKPDIAVIPIEVEEWLYNLGSRRLIQILRFENGRLVEVTTGHYGY